MPDKLLTFIHISDTHFSSPDYERPPSRQDPRRTTAALLAQLTALPYDVDFILHTGDVAYDPHSEIYPEIAAQFSVLEPPVIYIPGNHDHCGALQTVVMGRAEPQVPLYYEREMNGVRLLCLDSNGPEGVPPRGHVDDQQLAWLREKLTTPGPVLIFIHHPLLKTGTSQWYDEFMMTVNGDAVHEVIAGATGRVCGVFHGHIHHDMTFLRDGVMYSAVRSSWTQFHIRPGQGMETLNDLPADPGYALVTVTSESTFVQRLTYRLAD